MARNGLATYLAAAGCVSVAAVALAACQHYGQPKAVADASGGEPIPDKVDYSWDVRPILSQNCFQCHGNDPKNRKAGLRLDLADAAYGKMPEDPGKRAIVPGNPNKSELFRRITSTDSDYRMPPRDTHKTMSAHDVAVIEKWIKQGAKYKPHWAYIPPKEVRPEKTEWDKQAVNPIDRYIYAKLKEKGLPPSKEADRETLINRVTLDLTGLPPTLAEVDAFVADKDPNAYEHLVDRLLATTAYAERQAETWLDVARYADSDGYLNDNEGRFQHPYRDWVISAFKRNIPYDKFVTWQLAGDKLPNPTKEQVLATAFIRAGKKSNEGGIIDEEYRVEYVNERTELVGKAFLALTIGCAKCHDHKYDVIRQADYYSMGGFFNSIDESGIVGGGGRGTPTGPTQPWPTPTQAKRLAAADKVTAAKLAAYQAALAAAKAAAAPEVDAVLKGGAEQRKAFLTQATQADTQAYYPLDGTFKASFEPLMIDPTPPFPGAPGSFKLRQALAAKGGASKAAFGFGADAGPPDPDAPRLAGQEVRKALTDKIAMGFEDPRLANTIPILKRQLMVGLKADQLAWTPDARPDAKPGFVNNVSVIDGVHGKAIKLHNSVFAVGKGVGAFERTQPYTLDLWVKLRADKPYDDASIFYNSGGARGGGYNLDLRDNHLVFQIIHAAPYNMVEVETTDPLPKGRWTHLTVTYDGNSRAEGAKLYVDGKPAKTEVTHDRLTRSAMPRGGNSQFGSYYGLQAGMNFGRQEFVDGGIDEVRVMTRALTPIEVANLHNPALAAAEPAAAARDQMLEIAAERSPALIKARQELTDARLAEQRVETPIYQMMVAGDAPKPRINHILDHGQYDKYLEVVPTQALPKVFAWSDKLPKDRLGLTQWMFDPKNPLTARVFVNRLWQGHFGTGIVETVEDFGTQGSNPSHPELLDYLAIEFQRSGWDMKHMHKLMVMSATYRQSSVISKDALEKDPKNFLLARAPRYRMPAEMIRDNALAASGLLVAKVGGDSVFPYQPEGVWDGAGTGLTIYPTDVPADEMHRRSMYTFQKRNALFPSMAVFDMADRNVSTVQRRVSNTPLQALVLLNDPQYVEAYRKLAERVIKTTADSDQQVVTMFRLATRRRPDSQEMAALTRYRQSEEARLAATPAEAAKLLKIGVSPSDPGIDPVKLAAMTLVTAVVLNTPDAYSLR